MRAILLVLTIVCLSNFAFAQSSQSSTSKPASEDVTTNHDTSAILTGKDIYNLPSIKPQISLRQALTIARNYTRKEKINLSSHFLTEAKLVIDNNLTDKDKVQWYFKWVMYEPGNVPEIVILVSMKGQPSHCAISFENRSCGVLEIP